MTTSYLQPVGFFASEISVLEEEIELSTGDLEKFDGGDGYSVTFLCRSCQRSLVLNTYKSGKDVMGYRSLCTTCHFQSPYVHAPDVPSAQSLSEAKADAASFFGFPIYGPKR